MRGLSRASLAARIVVAAYLFGKTAWLFLLPLFAAAGLPGLTLCFATVLRLPAALISALSLKLLRLIGRPASEAAALLQARLTVRHRSR